MFRKKKKKSYVCTYTTQRWMGGRDTGEEKNKNVQNRHTIIFFSNVVLFRRFDRIFEHSKTGRPDVDFMPCSVATGWETRIVFVVCAAGVKSRKTVRRNPKTFLMEFSKIGYRGHPGSWRRFSVGGDSINSQRIPKFYDLYHSIYRLVNF